MEFSFLFLVGILTLRNVKQVLKLHAKKCHYNLYRNFSYNYFAAKLLFLLTAVCALGFVPQLLLIYLTQPTKD